MSLKFPFIFNFSTNFSLLKFQDARAAFRQELSESTQKLNAMSKKLGACIDKARPYYDARMRAKEVSLIVNCVNDF